MLQKIKVTSTLKKDNVVYLLSKPFINVKKANQN